MISNIAKEFINLAISKLELEKPTQEKINEATNYLKDAISQIKKEKEPREYKVWLFNALYDTNYVENEFVNALTGNFQSQNTYKHTDYIEIPSGVKELTLTLPICGNVGYHVGAFYDKDKKFLYGVSPNASSKYHMTEETLKITLEGNEKYLVLGSSSSGDLANAYYISSEEAKKVFVHESDSVYSVNTVEELKTIEAKTGDTIITKGYYEIGDNGEAIYDIVTYEEYATLLPKDIQLVKNTKGSLVPTPVDEFGNHTLNNGLVAKLRLIGETTPEQWGAKGDGVSNDCQAFVHMFGQIKTGRIIFKENATYLLGLIYEDDTITSFKDNPYKAYMCGGLLGGQFYSKPIMANINDVEFVGNNALITIPDNVFGNGGMGILNFAGKIRGLHIHDLRFNGKGGTLRSPNKNSNHTIFYAPSTYMSNSTLLKGIHPLYDSKTDSFSSGYFLDVEINNCEFFDAGAMYKRAGDYGGDFILIINPTIMDNLNVHHNKFEAWGRWVLAVDLGGYGECMTNVKFNDNICIGANAREWDEENYGALSNEDGSYKYIIDRNKAPKWLQDYDKKFNTNVIDDTWRWRGLGWIDFEAKKCWKNLECQRNVVVGSTGWAINGNSRVSENVLIKDNIWLHQGGGYPYELEFYSGFAKNWTFDNNVLCGGLKVGLTSENITVKNNRGSGTFRMFGLQGDIVFENNKHHPNDGLYYHKLLSLEGNRRPDYLPEDVPQKAKITFIGNDSSLAGNLNYNQPYIDFDIHDNSFDNLDIANFYQKDLGYNDYSKWVNGGVAYNGFHLTGNNQTKKLCPFGTYCREGETIIESIKEVGITVLQTTYHNTDILTPEQIKVIRWNNNNYQTLVGCTINGVKYNDFKMICTEEGIIPQASKYGFRFVMSDWRDFITTGNSLQNNAYIYYNRNLYLCTGTTEGVNTDQGRVDVNNPPIHTEGTEVCGTVYLKWIGKLGMAKLIGIE